MNEAEYLKKNYGDTASTDSSTGRKNGFTALLTRVKSYVKYSIGFDFTFDARRRCRQIYNLFAYSCDLGKGEVKLLTTLTSPLPRVKDEVLK